MKCQSCEEEVSPKFAYAIATNVCPFCGQPIMDEKLQKILNSLRELMTEASSNDFEEEINDWFRSNCGLISLESEDYLGLLSQVEILTLEVKELTEKYSKPTPKSGRGSSPSTIQMATDPEGNSVQVEGESIQDPDRTSLFMQRAQVSRVNEKQQDIKSMATRIKKSGSIGATTEGSEMVITPSMLASASAEEIEQMEAMLNPGAPGMHSVASSSSYDDEDELPAVVEAFMHQGNSSSGTYNARDVAKLQQLQNKSAKASRALDNGGSVGLIKR